MIALERSGLANDVVVVRDGEQALNYLRRQGDFASRPEGNPAFVILDLKLPKITGHEVLDQVRQSPELRAMPVVILTSSHEEPDVLRGYQLGVNAYVVKPVDFTQLVHTVSELGMFWGVLNEPPPGSARVKRKHG